MGYSDVDGDGQPMAKRRRLSDTDTTHVMEVIDIDPDGNLPLECPHPNGHKRALRVKSDIMRQSSPAFRATYANCFCMTYDQGAYMSLQLQVRSAFSRR